MFYSLDQTDVFLTFAFVFGVRFLKRQNKMIKITNGKKVKQDEKERKKER